MNLIKKYIISDSIIIGYTIHNHNNQKSDHWNIISSSCFDYSNTFSRYTTNSHQFISWNTSRLKTRNYRARNNNSKCKNLDETKHRKVWEKFHDSWKLICKIHSSFVSIKEDSSKKGRRRLDTTRDDGGYLAETIGPWKENSTGKGTRPFFAAIFATGSIEDPARRWEPLSVRCTIRDEDTSRSRKCTRRDHSVPESRIPRQLLIHRGLLNVAGARNGDRERAECEGGDKSGEP